MNRNGLIYLVNRLISLHISNLVVEKVSIEDSSKRAKMY